LGRKEGGREKHGSSRLKRPLISMYSGFISAVARVWEEGGEKKSTKKEKKGGGGRGGSPPVHILSVFEREGEGKRRWGEKGKRKRDTVG